MVPFRNSATESYPDCIGWHDGLLYACGGLSAAGNTHSYLNTFRAFDKHWIVGGLTSDAAARANAASGVIGNELFIAGGLGVGNEYLSTLQIYDFTARTWRLGVPLPQATHSGCGVVTDGKLYLVESKYSVFQSMMVYDVQSNTWTEQQGPPNQNAHGAPPPPQGYGGGGYGAPPPHRIMMNAFAHNGRIVTASIRTARRTTEELAATQIGTHSTPTLRQGLFTGRWPGPFSSASKYKCAKLTLPTPATRALQLPEVVARARRVAAERARPLGVQYHSLEAAALGRPAPEGPREVLIIRENACASGERFMVRAAFARLRRPNQVPEDATARRRHFGTPRTSRRRLACRSRRRRREHIRSPSRRPRRGRAPGNLSARSSSASCDDIAAPRAPSGCCGGGSPSSRRARRSRLF